MSLKNIKVEKANIINSLILFGILLLFNQNIYAQTNSLINTAHLDHLFEKININGKEMGIIHIYSNYPDYKYADAPGEGIACVDDAARAEIFYLNYYKITHDKDALKKVKLITQFLLHMQAKNGFFYNFIWQDHSIDSTYKTSVAQPNWWSWRAIWTLATALNYFKSNDVELAKKIKPVLKRAVNVTHEWLNNNFCDSLSNFEGIKVPAWLPYKYAADQAAVLVKGFVQYYKLTKANYIKKDIKKLCEGIIKMQKGNAKVQPYFAFLSWENTWHHWGNSQSDALVDAGTLLNKPGYILHAEREVQYFYPYLMNENYFNNFKIVKKQEQTSIQSIKKYSQIAYGIRPMVFASLNVYKALKDKKAARLAGEAACWLLGKNVANIAMYHPKTGVCYDGIIGKDGINRNSGAESTIEALLSILKVEQNPIAKKVLMKYYLARNNN